LRLVVDTNRIIASLIKDSVSRKIIKSGKIEFFTIRFGEVELSKYLNYIIEKARININEFTRIKESLFENIKVIDDSILRAKMKEAKIIMDEIDENDTPFIALALTIENNGIWSEDKHFENQNKIKVWKTKDLMRFL
jgi:predicted nucleic acid-binding protein|tara:strand:- start:15505 stop:15915 length:411 start_codon:yes stop_codon:yes gene_type:complete